MTQKLSDLQSAADSLKSQGDQTSAALAKSNGDRTGLQKKLVDLQKEFADEKGAAAKAKDAQKLEAETFMKARQQERISQNARFDLQTASLAVCVDKNQRLLQVSHELLLKYRDKGVLDAVRQDDPVLGFKDIDMFNQIQDYRDRIDTEKLAPPDPPKL